MLGEAQLYIHARSTALVMLLTPALKVRERAVNVAGEAGLARPWASENVAVRQRAGDIEAHIVVRGFPPYSSHYSHLATGINGNPIHRFLSAHIIAEVSITSEDSESAAGP
jgi:hypothetical protein